MRAFSRAIWTIGFNILRALTQFWGQLDQGPTSFGPLLVDSMHNVKVFWSSQNGSFVFNQIFVNGTLMDVDYKSEKKI